MSSDPARMIAKSARKFEDPAERAAYLDRVCHGIARLRADVERYLAEAEEAAEVAAGPEPSPAPGRTVPPTADTPAAEPPAAPAGPPEESADPTTEHPGDAIGRYRLVRSLGEGGFGTVWLADQLQPVRRQVALKIIKLGMDTAQVVARFEQERQALALMDHPNVARVLDAGATARGRPYFVMDLVQGVPIGEFCDTERLTVEARLELFAQVCAAVQHAHMKGIIHRDLKPSNILVANRDGKPHATVIDFGIAKATSSKLTDRSLVTEAYQVIGTLQYMSPEQSQASPDIDTRTDVYSLGVILYELLTGATPYDTDTLQRAVLSDILRMIGEADPPPPSARITETREAIPDLADSRSIDSRRLATKLRGELDWIVLKAIEKDRGRRYESADAFAADIRRYLSGEPVSAAPPSATYRMRKFVRRNRGMVAAASAVAASLVAGVVAFAWQAGVARDERDAAVKAREAESVERKRSEDVAELMESLFEGINPEGDSSEGDLRTQLVERLADLTRQLDSGSGDPLVGARMRLAIGRTLTGLSAHAEAEVQFRAARDLLRRHGAPGDPRADIAALGVVAAAEQTGRFAEAVALLEEFRAEQRAAGRATADDEADWDHMLGMIRQAEGRLDLAVPLFEAAAARVAARGGPATRNDLLVMHTLATAYRMTGRAAEAVDRLREVLAKRTALLGEGHADTLMTANSLAVALSSAGRNAEALEVQKSNLERLLRVRAPDHAAVLNAHANHAATLTSLGRHDEAIAELELVCRTAAARYPAASPDRVRMSMALASAYAAARRVPEAVRTFEEIRAPMLQLWGPTHDSVVAVTVGVADAVSRAGAPAKAQEWLEEAAAAAEKAGGPAHAATLRLRQKLGLVLRNAGEAARAAEVLADVLAKRRASQGDGHADTLAALHDLGCAQFSLGDGAAAAATFEQALEGRRKLLGEDHPETIQSQGCLGSSYWLSGKLDRSVPLLEDTLARQVRVLGPDSESTIHTVVDLAINLNAAREPEKLFAHLREWLPRLLRIRGLKDEQVQGMLNAFVGECGRKGRLADAVPALEVQHAALLVRNGPDDEETLSCGVAYGTALWYARAFDRSVPIYEDLYARRVRLEGPDSPKTIKVAANLAVNLRDAGRTEEAIALFEDTIRRDLAVNGPSSPEQGFYCREYARALHRAGRAEQAAAAMREFVAGARRRSRPQSLQLAADLVQAGLGMLDFGVPVEAEALLRECVSIREQAEPAAWSTHSARSALGGALLAQRRFAEAEPLLTASAEALVRPDAKVPAAAMNRVDEARERVLRLYTEWHAAEPGKGHDAKLSEWRTRFGTK